MEIAVGSELGTSQQQTHDACCSEALAPDVALLAVADGFGTFGRGSVADAAIATIREFFRRKMRGGALASASAARSNASLALRRMILAAFAHANNRIYTQSGSHDDYVAAGASLTTALVVGSQVYIGHVGESRAYLARGEKLTPLTEDDAIVSDSSGSGKMTTGARLRSLLTRTLGTQPTLEATVAHFELQDDDKLILCTDGVHKTLSNEELEFATSSPGTAAEVVDRILALLKMRGNKDGGTVIIGCRLTIPALVARDVASRRGISGGLGITFVVLAVIVVAALVYEALVPLHIALR